MSTNVQSQERGSPFASFSGSIGNYVLRLGALALIDAVGLWLLIQMYGDGVWQLATMLLLITVGLNVVILREDLYPLRWMSPGLALLLLMVLYPILFTVYIAFTNYGDGHLLTKQQAIELITREQFLPEDAVTYGWTAYRSPTGDYVLALTPEEGGEVLLARTTGEPAAPVAAGQAGVGELDEDGLPLSVEGYQRLERRDLIRRLSELQDLEFGAPPNTIKISSLNAAARFQPRYVYDASQDAIIDQQSGTVYVANAETGNFVAADGSVVRPGYRVEIGARNFERIFTNPALRGPFLRVFIWTFAFAFFSVITSFALGLTLAIFFNDPELPGRKLIRSLLLIPYTIPAVISILIWRGLLNPNFGVINDVLRATVGFAPQWFTNPLTAKIGILLINLWLGYPYMMLIATGALQAIPSDIYEAAQVDGASPWQSFWNITLPLLLVSLGPLLISSFAFNFNNFNVIFLYNEGGPPISGAPTPAGHTDILISYTYRLAFAGGRGADYGFAAAITIIIFLLVATVTFFQFRYTKVLEEISENV